ncbi:MAG: HAMP domain-containing sensor histidine kinase [Acidiphilium sp.]|nr:HAMP domain-containing sensor histidine kinase [Acidiphilium sp.]MDD4936427.1 HAMP domain-containing sensor histidine kinase [Acidiphilium sp.]
MPPKLVRTTSVRLASLGVGFALVGATVVFAVIYAGTLGALRTTLDTNINNEIAEILIDGSRTPQPIVLANVRTAIAAPPRDIFYLLADAHGRVQAADLSVPIPRPGWHTLTAAAGREFAPHIRVLRGRADRLASGDVLFVAADATMLEQLDALIRRSFLIGFGVTLAIGLAGGIGFGRRALARVEAVSTAGQEIMAGDFTRRIPLSGSGDEFDHLASVINAMLARIEQLLGNIRAVGDEIAHDLRSPLARLRESLELLHRNPDPALVPAALADAIAQVDATLALAAAILRLAQIEGGARRASFARVDLTRLLEDLAETYETVAEDADVRLTATIAPDLALNGDAALLTQMIANLIENAITHGGSGSTITVTARQDDAVIELIIADDGPGIPPSRHGEALRRFGRLDASRATEGHGLGLPLAAAIATLHEASFNLGTARRDAARPGLAVTIRLWSRRPC